eukprot:TRINITY_DN931_c0_g3_i3.p1 TRINITY_DN931_c0_g3~~TRINITY_DN931_c0_g3_i3.p1  ORF type:complete len:396 (+),score=55.11 TRINITY_DN931_c0_g3_i3:151-1338(+)
MAGFLEVEKEQSSSSDEEEAQGLIEPQKVSGAPRLEALDATRWIASISIVLSHVIDCVPGDKPPLVEHLKVWGGKWTQFFFMLSGFVLSYVEMTRPESKQFALSTADYVKRRLSTVYPTYIFAIVITVFAEHRDLLDWLTLPLHLLLLQGWFPLVYQSVPEGRAPDAAIWIPGAGRWCATSWFLSVLLLYWIILPPIAKRVHRLSLTGTLGLLLLCWAFSLVFVALPWLRQVAGVGFGDATTYTCFQFAWPGYVHVFVAGIAAARLFILTCISGEGFVSSAPILFQYGCVLGYGLYVALVLWGPVLANETNYGTYMVAHNGGLIPIMLLIICGAALGKDPLARYALATPLFVVLGRISYGSRERIACNVFLGLTCLQPNGSEECIACNVLRESPS